MVTILQLMGFLTTASCGGHIRRITNGPYVIFVSPRACSLESQVSSFDFRDPEFKRVSMQAKRFSVIERERLINHLETFYADRPVSYRRQLIVTPLGLSASQLYTIDAERARTLSEQERKDLLQTNRAEMQQFADFLKARYFAGLTPTKRPKTAAHTRDGYSSIQPSPPQPG